MSFFIGKKRDFDGGNSCLEQGFTTSQARVGPGPQDQNNL
jgi:hypothetical protein